MAALFLCPFPAVALVYLLMVVPLVGSWLSGWPEMRVAVRFSAVVGGLSFVLALGSSSAAWILWDRGIVGNKFPFVLEVPEAFDGLVLVEICATGPDSGRIVRLSPQGLASFHHGDPGSLCGRSVVEVREVGGLESQGSNYLCEPDPATGCVLVGIGVSRTAPWGHPFPTVPLSQLLLESRSSGRSVTEVSADHPPVAVP